MQPIRRAQGWIACLVVCGVAVYAVAEDLTLTTYYPSPRGVYRELRTSGDVAIGTTSAPTARLQVIGDLNAPALYVIGKGGTTTLRVDDADSGDASPFLINSAGDVGIGTADPAGFKLRVEGAMKLTGNLVDAASQVVYNQSAGQIPRERLPSIDGADCPTGQYARGIDANGNAAGCATDAVTPPGGVTFGGMYTRRKDILSQYYCDFANPLTGSCSCPSTFIPAQITRITDNRYESEIWFCYK